jgi:hypothetical protein
MRHSNRDKSVQEREKRGKERGCDRCAHNDTTHAMCDEGDAMDMKVIRGNEGEKFMEESLPLLLRQEIRKSKG